MKRTIPALLVLLTCIVLAPASEAQNAYTVIDLGVLGTYTYPNGVTFTASSASAVNNAGQVVGVTSTSSSPTHAYLYSNGSMTDLGTPMVSRCSSPYVPYSVATGINDSGQIVGFSACPNGTNFTGWVLNDGTATAIPGVAACPTYFQPAGINASGAVIGSTCFGSGGSQAAIYSGGTTTGLGVLYSDVSTGGTINNFGQASGYTYVSGGLHAFLYSGGVMNDLGSLGGTKAGYGSSYSVGTSVNDSGQVAGYSIGADSYFHAFLYRTGAMNDLGVVQQGYDAYTGGMNNVGEIVGFAQYADSSNTTNLPFGWLYTSTGGFLNLNTLLPSTSGWTIRQATAVNDEGQITASGVRNGSNHGLLLNPAGYTPVGSNVYVQPVDSTSNGTPVSLTFSSVTQAGSTTLSTSSSGPAAPNGFKLGQPPVYYNVSTTAVYSGPVTLCINYTGVNFKNPSNNAIWHYDSTVASWTKLATTVNTTTTTACASTPSLSPFALFETAYAAQVQQPINPDGSSVFSAARGVIPVKFTLELNGVASCGLPPGTIAVTRTAGGTTGSIDESTYSMSADSGPNFRIDTTSCQYVYNLSSSALGSGVYRVDILINTYAVGSGFFALK
jgi:probable HAF family extracellular repeat protein